MKKFTVTIGIPAYNEEANILQLLGDIAKQNQKGYIISQIIVVSDASNDDTVSQAMQFTAIPTQIISHKKRVGKSGALNTITAKTKSDALVILDADVYIKDKNFLTKLITPIAQKTADLVAANIGELSPNSILEKMLAASMEFKRSLFTSIRDGNTIYTCHGRGRAFSKKLYKAIHFKSSANEDAYSYLFCIHKGYNYTFIPDAIIWYALPKTLKDHEYQSVRFFHSRTLSESEFGKSFVQEAYTLPKKTMMTSLISFVGVNPYIVPYLILMTYLSIKSRFVSQVKNTWHVATSSKTLHRRLSIWIAG